MSGKSYNTYLDKVQLVVKRRMVKERVKFQGKMITREKVEIEFNLPKIINTDISYQLMFGNKPSIGKYKQDSGIEQVFIKESQAYGMD
tara:strand:+ start:130 stop:393 length:264 start_codon:yes stop_codon:yes gene_type:complete